MRFSPGRWAALRSWSGRAPHRKTLQLTSAQNRWSDRRWPLRINGLGRCRRRRQQLGSGECLTTLPHLRLVSCSGLASVRAATFATNSWGGPATKAEALSCQTACSARVNSGQSCFSLFYVSQSNREYAVLKGWQTAH